MFVSGTTSSNTSYEIENSLRFSAAAETRLFREQVEGNRKTWTWSAWVKRGALNTEQFLFGAGNIGSDDSVAFMTTNRLRFDLGGGIQGKKVVSAPLNDTSAYYHIVCVCDLLNAASADRMRIFINGTRALNFDSSTNPSSSYSTVVNSVGPEEGVIVALGQRGTTTGLHFDGVMADVHFIDGQALGPENFGRFDSNDVWVPKAYSHPISQLSNLLTNPSFDSGGTGWTASPDDANGTVTFSGGNVTMVGTGSKTISQSYSYTGIVRVAVNVTAISNGTVVVDGEYEIDSVGVTWYVRGANGNETVSVFKNAGTSVTISEITVVPQTPIGNSSTLKFNNGSNLGALGTDSSGYGNHWATTNFNLTDTSDDYSWLKDTPTDNFPQWSQLNTKGANSFSRTQTRAVIGATNNVVRPTFVEAGGLDYYVEFSGFSGTSIAVGIGRADATDISAPHQIVPTASGSQCITYTASTGQIRLADFVTATVATWTTTDVIGMLVSMATPTSNYGSITFYKNGVAQHTINGWVSATPPLFVRAPRQVVVQSTGGTQNVSINFGQRPFRFPVPADQQSARVYNKVLSTKRMEAVPVTDPKSVFDAFTYVGTGAARQFTTLKHRPALVWIKNTGAAQANAIFDGSRYTEVEASYSLPFDSASDTKAEFLDGGFGQFLSNGFSLTGNSTRVNASSNNYVAWSFSGSEIPLDPTTKLPVINNTLGSIPSAAYTDTNQFISIVQWVGTGASSASIGHGFSVNDVPRLIMVRGLSVATDWYTDFPFTSSGTSGLRLNTTAATASSLLFSPGVNTLSMGTTGAATLNVSGTRYIAYCFRRVPGLSWIGRYVGNGSNDGSYVWCGFKPRWILIKRTDVAENWRIFDTARNPNSQPLGFETYTNLNNAQAAVTALDVLSDGFKLRTTAAGLNAGGGSYAFMAIAQSPFGGRNVAPATAR